MDNIHEIIINYIESVPGVEAKVTLMKNLGGLEEYKIQVESEEEIYLPKIEIQWFHPMHDAHVCWHPGSFRQKGTFIDSVRGFNSRVTTLAPVVSYFSSLGENVMTFALSDALNNVDVRTGVHEEDSTINCRLTLFTEQIKPTKYYETVLIIDSRKIKFNESLNNISSWWESFDFSKPLIAPEIAKLPMYSTWYSYHQEITSENIEEECILAKDLGCESIIVDDGWQTDNNNRGYAYCGDWEVFTDKIPDMRAHVERVHKLGLKYLLWYSVPFVGVKSNKWSKSKDKILRMRARKDAGILDPRYKEVRDFIIGLYEKALIEWDLDGFKLDFVDEFYLPENNVVNEEMDYISVQEAVDVLLSDIVIALKKIKPDIMIEFRQKYIGPYMRNYGNIFRVTDCANDFINNRIGSMDIRLICGKTVVHSDMIMWNMQEKVESAALQFNNILFSVPQFSMRFAELSKEHKAMVKFYFDFWLKHRKVLLEGKLTLTSPELMYPIIRSDNPEERLIAVYSDFVVESGTKLPKDFIVVNATMKNRLVIKFEETIENAKIVIKDCMGNQVTSMEERIELGIREMQIPPSGVLEIKSI